MNDKEPQAAANTPATGAERYSIVNGYLVETANGCTCHGGGPYGHEPGCGMEPVALLSDLLDIHAVRYQPLAALAGEVEAINQANGWTRGAELRDRQAEDDDQAAELNQAQLAHQITELMLVVTEAAEAVEELRAGHLPHAERYRHHNTCPVAWRAPEHQHTVSCTCTPKPLGVPSELADVVIRVLDFARTWGIDLDKAVAEKLAYNATRGLHHGGKAI